MLQLDQRDGSKRVVIVGCGGLGASIATTLAERGHIVHILDSHAESFDRLPPGMVEEGHIVPVLGDGVREDDLIRASVIDADVLIAVSGSDAQNALAAQMAKQVYAVSVVICRIDDSGKQEMYNELGLVAVSATNVVAEIVLEAVLG